MLFPWIGLFEQIRLADTFVYYDDVAFSKGSFQNRVQYKTAAGLRWLTVPLVDTFLGQKICDVRINNDRPWRRTHLASLAQAHARAPFRNVMLGVVEEAYAEPAERLGELTIRTMDIVCRRLGLDAGRRFIRISELGIGGKGSDRVLAIVRHLGGDRYVTGWGARNYLDHEAFERQGIRVSYMAYQCIAYPQLHGEFDPHVSILDGIANCAEQIASLICSGTMDWRDFLK